jgi:hypothetical protein
MGTWITIPEISLDTEDFASISWPSHVYVIPSGMFLTDIIIWDSKRHWQWRITLRIAEFLDFVHRLVFWKGLILDLSSKPNWEGASHPFHLRMETDTCSFGTEANKKSINSIILRLLPVVCENQMAWYYPKRIQIHDDCSPCFKEFLSRYTHKRERKLTLLLLLFQAKWDLCNMVKLNTDSDLLYESNIKTWTDILPHWGTILSSLDL